MITLDKTTGMSTGTEQSTTMITPTYPGHQEGLTMNDLVTLHSLLVCNALAGNIGLSIRTEVRPAQKCGEQHRIVWGAKWCDSCAGEGVWHN